jgi:GTPase SAR1 family protein
MNSPNAHIEKFLDYFFALLHSPEYAVMLKGPWGCGKTWFINRYCEKLEREGKKHLYISLHGIGSFAEINDAIFEQLHPVLSSKGMALAGKILKGLLKTTLKIDLSQEGHSNMSIKSQVPDFSITDLPDYLKDTSRHLLIFDDLERCRINISDVLGYINQFVEHHGYKVIIIANEDEINKIERTNEDSSTQFKRINEKLIGKTFLILSDVNALLNDTISTILNKRVKDFIDKNKELIIEIYQDSTYENLRQLKQSLWDFERFMIEMPPKAWEKEPLLEHMLSLFLAYSFEIKSGTILANEIGRVKSTYYTKAGA